MEGIVACQDTGLYHVLIEVTKFCNLRCDHCYSKFEDSGIIEVSILEA